MGRNAEIIRAFYDAYNRRDWEALAAHLSPSVEWFHASRGERICGREAVAALLQSSAEAFPQARIHVANIHETGATVASEWTYLAGGTAPSGPPRALACDIKQLRQGKLIRGATYGDTLQMLLDLAAVPAKPELPLRPELPRPDDSLASTFPSPAIIPPPPPTPTIRFRAA
jgi:ketosteroid isomerase-like protein